MYDYFYSTTENQTSHCAGNVFLICQKHVLVNKFMSNNKSSDSKHSINKNDILILSYVSSDLMLSNKRAQAVKSCFNIHRFSLLSSSSTTVGSMPVGV